MDMATVKTKLNIDSDELKKIKLVAVAYSFVDKDLFPNEEAYKAEKEVEDRAQQVIAEIKKLGLEAKGYPGDQYLLTNLLVDRQMTSIRGYRQAKTSWLQSNLP
jgi:hypothetical protein